MTTRETYSVLATLSLMGAAWLLAGFFGPVILLFGIWFAQVDLSWIPDEPGDIDALEQCDSLPHSN